MAAVAPVISIKAGKCTQNGTRIVPQAEPGLLYLYHNPDDELLHFCWKPRGAVEPAAEDDLIIIPGDARIIKYTGCTTGRVMVLKFSSSSQRHFFWLQSKAESSNPGHWSARDDGWVHRINVALQGPQDDDEEMGDIGLGSEELEEEGSASRRGGADGGRAPTSQPQNQSDFLQNLISQIQLPGAARNGGGGHQQQQPMISLHDLLPSTTTTPLLTTMTPGAVDDLISNLPQGIVPRNATLAQKKEVILKVLHSPQFNQSLVSLSVALRDGGLRGISDSLGVRLAPGEEGTGSDQVTIFVEAIKKEEEKKEDGNMDID
ncbi:adhesion regulating molecule [Choiromyces venosus 120613-1]|uniref:Adhesion regulating molecule n=1 Tax=Choiromyces venosus 120613-1 TaxID=1336337 RepID=A0A3N4JS59_9PEZI|nr:adhesion regulating molecule [Choiromyces venosus 120613-1]